MKVFHGSDLPIDVIDLNKSKPGKDFGQGFYVTKIYRQAEKMALNVAKRNQTQPDNLSSQSAHRFDIIEGPVADDAVSIRIRDYMNGKVAKQAFLEELKFRKDSHQICFCTFQSLQMLRRACHEIDSIYHIDDWVIQQLITDYGLSDMRANDLYFDSVTYSHLIDENNKLYQTPWTEIYKLLIQELMLKK
jgi:hypothetical protein